MLSPQAPALNASQQTETASSKLFCFSYSMARRLNAGAFGGGVSLYSCSIFAISLYNFIFSIHSLSSFCAHFPEKSLRL